MHKSKILDIYMKLRNIIWQLRFHNYIINKIVFDKKTWNNHRQYYVLPLYWQPWRNFIVDNKNRPHRVNGFHLCKWINTICCQINPKITGFFFKVRPLFLHISKCRTICRNSNKIILTSVPSMVIHKLRYVIAPEQSLKIRNDWNITKNLVRHLFCYVIVWYLLIWHSRHFVANTCWL